MKTQINVTFEGEEKPTTLRIAPVGLMAAERRWGQEAWDQHPIEAMFFGAWVTLGKPGGVDGFDGWAATISDIDMDALAAAATGDGETADPTSATPIEPSPTSQ